MLIDECGEKLSRLMEAIKKVDAVGFDCETTGLKPWRGDRICGVALYHPAVGAVYLPFRHREGRNLPECVLGSLLQELCGKTLVGHNLKFDAQMVAAETGRMPDRIEDSLLAAHLANENEYRVTDGGVVVYRSDGKPATDFSLATLARKYLGAADSKAAMDAELKARGEDKSGLWKLPPRAVAKYAGEDARLAWDLVCYYVRRLVSQGLLELWREVNDYALAVAKMEARGVALDREAVARNMDLATFECARLIREIEDLTWPGFNPASSAQAQLALGLPSSDRKALQEISGREDNPKAPLAAKLLEYRAWAKVSGSYYRPYLEECGNDGAVHPQFLLHGTVTGRLSCHSPNLQAVPRESDVYRVKEAFVARPGRLLVSADYSQAELRWTAHYSGDEALKAKLLSGGDVHGETARELGIPRDAAKRINFGIVYGIGPRKLSQELNVSEKQAREYLQKYTDAHPGVRALLVRAEKAAESRGYIRMFTGRMRRYGPHSPSHKACSNLIQGAVAEMLRLALMRVDREMPDCGILLQVHDQLLVEVPEDRAAQAAREVAERMVKFSEYADKMKVPMAVEVKVGRSWGRMVSLEDFEKRGDKK